MFVRRIPQCLLALCLAAPLAQADTVKIPDRLKNTDKLVFCGGMDSPPMGFYDSEQKPTGFTVELGQAFAQRLGNKAIEWRVTPFSGLIPPCSPGSATCSSTSCSTSPSGVK